MVNILYEKGFTPNGHTQNHYVLIRLPGLVAP
jgi:hypothetical protein